MDLTFTAFKDIFLLKNTKHKSNLGLQASAKKELELSEIETNRYLHIFKTLILYGLWISNYQFFHDMFRPR